MEGMQASAASVTGLKKKLGAWATAKGFEGTSSVQKKSISRDTTLWSNILIRCAMPWGWTIANTLILSKIRERLGPHETRLLHVGGETWPP